MSLRWAAWVSTALLCMPSLSMAFTLETAFSEGCHERITLAAARRAAWPKDALAPAPGAADVVLANNLMFKVPARLDPWSVALMVGVRDNDLEGYALTDLPELAQIHGAADQSSHCLRSATQDFEQGNDEALAACRGFIHREIELAVGPKGEADLDATEDVRVALRYQRQAVKLSRYAFHMGRALHALQDSYAHSFRTGETDDVVGVLNYVEAILPAVFNLKRDGHAHLGALDACSGSPTADRRAQEATDASSALLEASAGSTTAAERRQKIEAVLDRALHYVAGCDSDNEWCGAYPSPTPQLKTSQEAHGCVSTQGASLVAFAVVAELLRRRSRR